MKRFLLSLLLSVSSISAFAATGDILWASTTNSANQPFYQSQAMISLCIDGLNIGGTVNTGFNNNTSGAVTNFDYLTLLSAKIVVSVTSQGFDTNGNAATVHRTLFGTQLGRKVWPSNSVPNIINNGSSVTLSFWLDEPIYRGDSNITVNVASGLYTYLGIPNSATTSMVVTNLSNEPYPNLISQWTWPGNEMVQTSWTNHYIGVQKFAFNNAPVAKAYDVARDAHGNVVTNIATLVCDRTSLGNPIVEYISVHSAANFTQGDHITNNFYLIPWVGTTNNIFVTSNSAVSAWIGPHTNVCDKSDLLTSIAFFSPSGDDSTGIATNKAGIDAARALPCATVTQALLLLDTRNNSVNSRNNSAGSIIYLTAGNNNLQSPHYGWHTHSGDDSWVTVTHDIGLTRADCVITNLGSLAAGPDTTFLKLKDITLWQQTDYIYLYSIPSVWMDNCYFKGFPNGSQDILNAITSEMNTTSCIISNNHSHGYWYGMTRGCLIDNAYRFAGGTYIGNNIYSNPSDNSDMFGFLSDNMIVAYNGFYSAPRLVFGFEAPAPHYGLALVQNVFETIGGSPQPVISVSTSDNSAGCTNVVMTKNTTIGTRNNLFYYDNPSGSGPIASSGPSWVDGVCMYDNLFGGLANKNDGFTGGSSSIGTNQYGNWQFSNGVGCKGNVFDEWTQPDHSWGLAFIGINSAFLNYTSNTDLYINDASGASSNLGSGNYRLQSQSLSFIGVRPSWNGLPWDLEGNNRGTFDPPGAYAAGNYKKGMGFFQ